MLLSITCSVDVQVEMKQERNTNEIDMMYYYCEVGRRSLYPICMIDLHKNKTEISPEVCLF